MAKLQRKRQNSIDGINESSQESAEEGLDTTETEHDISLN